MRVASIDIGSNSAILLIAEWRGGIWHRLSDRVEVTRISQGLDRTGALAPGPVLRTAKVLEQYGALAREAGVDQIVATGTAPFRRASNGQQVALELSRILGVAVKVVSGEEEARLSLIATRTAFPRFDAMTIVDIGGASTEVIVMKGEQHSMISMDIGTVRLTERVAGSCPITYEHREEAIKQIQRSIDRSGVAGLLSSAPAPLIGIAGTVTTLATIDMAMEVYDEQRVHGATLQESTLQGWDGQLWSMTATARKELAGLPPKRADVIPMGSLLLLSIMQRMGTEEVIVSDRGVRWGRLAEVKRCAGSSYE